MEFGPNPFNGTNIKTLNIPCSTLTPEEITEIFGDSVTVNYKHDIKYSASGSAISYACADYSDDTTKSVAEVKAEKAVYDGKTHEATVTKTGTFADEENHGKRAEVSEEAEESEDTDDTDVDEKSDNVIVTDEDDDMNPATGIAISFAGVAISTAVVLLAKKRNK